MIKQIAIANPFSGITVPGGYSLVQANSTPGAIVYSILTYTISFAGLALLVYLLWGGLEIMLSKGDPKAMQAAQARITYAILGFILIFLAYTLTKLVGLVFGITIIGTIFK
jgi:hypothetical protein